MGSITNTEILDGIIIGRVEPHIYAFSTQTAPNYLKVGDTYRPVEIRLNEWRKHFPNLEKQFSEASKVGDDAYFRDFAIHHFLENEKQRARLLPETLPKLPYYSKEFFKDATEEDLLQAIADINNDYDNNGNKYQFYKFDESRLPITHTYPRTAEYPPRPNQEATITKFNEALAKGRTNLLMYAVMRFGKSFTSMCCAVEMNAKLVVVVSAKADVQQEWKKTVQSHIKFKNYVFFFSDNLQSSDTILTEQLKTKNIVVFLTLQDLQGDEIKNKHKEIFGTNIDLLIVDETHFGARATEFSKAISSYDKAEYKKQKQEFEQNDKDFEDFGTEVKALQSKVRLHLSGTPYRILMGSEFTPDDIIGFYQFTDIVTDQEAWDNENLCKDDVKEWDNPYYGFPQMVRFAFNPNESSIKKMEEMRRNNISCAFTALFKPKSRRKDTKNNNHKQFEHEQEILELFEVIDGSKNDNNLLGFLDYDKIKDGKMCRHIVCVVPYKASCDALECLIKNNSDKFKNLNEYEIINIAGVDDERTYNKIETVKAKIKECEQEGKKTLTLTVNRMLTGTTVEEWDTMIYLKDTQSPQEYDQAIFRIQNQHIKTYTDSNGDEIKYNMKPQTLLVDFAPDRLFRMQEQKSFIYNVNTDAKGNDEVVKRLELEVGISPIIRINAGKLEKVIASNIIQIICDYSEKRSVADEAMDIGVDLSLMEIAEIKAEIDRQAEINSKGGLLIKPNEKSKDGGADLDGGDVEQLPHNEPDTTKAKKNEESSEEKLRKRFATYYSRLLFYAFLTKSDVRSVYDIIRSVENNDDNKRIIINLNIELNILMLFRKHITSNVLRQLDFSIQRINTISNADDKSPIDKAEFVLRKFGRMSESEIVTPANIADDMVATLPEDEITDTTKILDIAAKQGEFAVALYKKFGDKIKNNIYSIPTSTVAYEFTRKVYEMLGLPIDNIYSDFNSSDIIAEGNEQIIKKLEDMRFDIVVGNPPYQLGDGGAQASSKPIYQFFVDIAKEIKPKYITMIMPSRWYAGGKGKELAEFRNAMLHDKHIKEFHDFLHPEEVFPDTNNRGGVCYFIIDKDYDNLTSKTKVVTHEGGDKINIQSRFFKTKNIDTFIRHGESIPIIEKVNNSKDFKSFVESVSVLRPYGFRGYFINDPKFRSSAVGLETPIICYGKGKKIGFVDKEEIMARTEWIDIFKVFTPRANNIGTELNDDNFNTFVGKLGTICTESYIVLGANLGLNLLSSENLRHYFTTRFSRFMHSLAKAGQDATSKTYQFVPMQDFTENSDIDWSKSIPEIDKQLYAKYKLTEDEIAFIESMIKPMQ